MDNNIDEPEDMYDKFVVATFPWGLLGKGTLSRRDCTHKHPWHRLIMQEYYLEQ